DEGTHGVGVAAVPGRRVAVGELADRDVLGGTGRHGRHDSRAGAPEHRGWARAAPAAARGAVLPCATRGNGYPPDWKRPGLQSPSRGVLVSNRRSVRIRSSIVATAALTLAAIAVVASATAAETVGNFSYGQLGTSKIGGSGCGTNIAGEPAIHVSRVDNVFLGSENGLGNGSELWRGLGALGGSGASGCALEYRA